MYGTRLHSMQPKKTPKPEPARPGDFVLPVVLTGGKWWKFCPGACSPGIAGGYRICCHSSKPW